MNDQTPKRITGTLVERAAALYGLAPTLPVFDEPAPLAKPAPDPVAVPAPQPAAVQAVAPAPAPAAPAPVQRPARVGAAVNRAKLASAGMLVPGGPVTVLAEELRLVKRQLLLTSRAVAKENPDKARTVLVCSARPNEGKTFCAINLALSMAAEKDVEILLVDADFAKPDVLDRLGIAASGPGLLEALGDPSIDVEACVIETDVPKLAVLPAGRRTNADTELLASDRANDVLGRLISADPRRIIIFDSPPALAASPASVLALHAGQIMLVVRADKTGESDLRQAVALLDGCEHIQLVINSVSFAPNGSRFGNYYEEHGA